MLAILVVLTSANSILRQRRQLCITPVDKSTLREKVLTGISSYVNRNDFAHAVAGNSRIEPYKAMTTAIDPGVTAISWAMPVANEQRAELSDVQLAPTTAAEMPVQPAALITRSGEISQAIALAASVATPQELKQRLGERFGDVAHKVSEAGIPRSMYPALYHQLRGQLSVAGVDGLREIGLQIEE